MVIEDVGTAVGCDEGCEVGIVGWIVGTADISSFVGLRVGLFEVGYAELGLTVGETVDGDADCSGARFTGCLVGLLKGCADGCDEGCVVGCL